MASVGSTLRLAREQRGLTIEQVAQDTRISQRFLEAIERDEFDALPAPVYVRGFIRSYSSYLRLDAAPLLAELALQGLGGAQATTQAFPPAQQEPPAARDTSAERRAVDPFARPTSPRAPEPERTPPPPAPVERSSAPPAASRAPSPPGRPTPPPPIPPDAIDDGFA
ncbi:MAG: helix-turn-helix domain-containing protein, partial [Dehalococcoidia bacterium]